MKKNNSFFSLKNENKNKDKEFSKKFKKLKDDAGFENEFDQEKDKKVKKLMRELGELTLKKKYGNNRKFSESEIMRVGKDEWDKIIFEKNRKVTEKIKKFNSGFINKLNMSTWFKRTNRIKRLQKSMSYFEKEILNSFEKLKESVLELKGNIYNEEETITNNSIEKIRSEIEKITKKCGSCQKLEGFLDLIDENLGIDKDDVDTESRINKFGTVYQFLDLNEKLMDKMNEIVEYINDRNFQECKNKSEQLIFNVKDNRSSLKKLEIKARKKMGMKSDYIDKAQDLYNNIHNIEQAIQDIFNHIVEVNEFENEDLDADIDIYEKNILEESIDENNNLNQTLTSKINTDFTDTDQNNISISKTISEPSFLNNNKNQNNDPIYIKTKTGSLIKGLASSKCMNTNALNQDVINKNKTSLDKIVKNKVSGSKIIKNKIFGDKVVKNQIDKNNQNPNTVKNEFNSKVISKNKSSLDTIKKIKTNDSGLNKNKQKNPSVSKISYYNEFKGEFDELERNLMKNIPAWKFICAKYWLIGKSLEYKKYDEDMEEIKKYEASYNKNKKILVNVLNEFVKRIDELKNQSAKKKHLESVEKIYDSCDRYVKDIKVLLGILRNPELSIENVKFGEKNISNIANKIVIKPGKQLSHAKLISNLNLYVALFYNYLKSAKKKKNEVINAIEQFRNNITLINTNIMSQFGKIKQDAEIVKKFYIDRLNKALTAIEESKELEYDNSDINDINKEVINKYNKTKLWIKVCRSVNDLQK